MTDEELDKLADKIAERLRKHEPHVSDYFRRETKRPDYVCPSCGRERVTDGHRPKNWENMCRCIRA